MGKRTTKKTHALVNYRRKNMSVLPGTSTLPELGVGKWCSALFSTLIAYGHGKTLDGSRKIEK